MRMRNIVGALCALALLALFVVAVSVPNDAGASSNDQVSLNVPNGTPILGDAYALNNGPDDSITPLDVGAVNVSTPAGLGTQVWVNCGGVGGIRKLDHREWATGTVNAVYFGNSDRGMHVQANASPSINGRPALRTNSTGNYGNTLAASTATCTTSLGGCNPANANTITSQLDGVLVST